MEVPFQPVKPKEKKSQAADRLKQDDLNTSDADKLVSIRFLFPNLVTLLAICSGLTAIRMAFENRFEIAVIAILFAAVLDGIDGRVARFFKATSDFGAQMDSLADFVNFGVAPAMVVYFWGLYELKSWGWIAALVFAICNCLRLARFNVMLDDENLPDWHSNYFMGVPAPAGAVLALIPLYLTFLGADKSDAMTSATSFLLVAVGLLMVSTFRTYSGKNLAETIPGETVMPLFIAVVLFAALLFSFPWKVMSILSAAYLISIPISVVSFKKSTRTEAVSSSEATTIDEE